MIRKLWMKTLTPQFICLPVSLYTVADVEIYTNKKNTKFNLQWGPLSYAGTVE